jgi:CRISPR-associated protein Cas1
MTGFSPGSRGCRSAAARHFGAMAALAPPSLGFTGRNRRPPRDPLNALLSFGYVLVGNEIQSLLDGMGFDPYIGFYHQIDYGRPSLALDLVEELRAPLVDRFSLGLVMRRVLTPEDFTETPDKGVLLQRPSLRTYFKAYQEELTRPLQVDGETTTFRHLFRRQAERLARCLVHGEPYRSFQWIAD